MRLLQVVQARKEFLKILSNVKHLLGNFSYFLLGILACNDKLEYEFFGDELDLLEVLYDLEADVESSHCNQGGSLRCHVIVMCTHFGEIYC